MRMKIKRRQDNTSLFGHAKTGGGDNLFMFELCRLISQELTMHLCHENEFFVLQKIFF